MKEKATALFFIFCVLITVPVDQTLSAEETTGGTSILHSVKKELKRGILEGETGMYYEALSYDKSSFIEDDETVDLNDSNLVVPFFQVNYITAAYAGIRIGAGLTAYSHIDDNSDRRNSIEDDDDIVVHQLYLGYEISHTFLKIGRMEFEESLLLSDYYEALSLVCEEIENVVLFLAVVDKVAESDIDKFIEFENINGGDDSIDEYLFALETTWNVVPDAIIPTLYYYHQGSLYDLYGAHIKVFHKEKEIGFGVHMDAYATSEDNRNGLKDTDDKVHDSNIYHISPFLEVNDFTLAAGYIGADQDVGAREGLIDDYFNPFNEGDKVYEPDGETWYSSLSYKSERFSIELVFGRTDYRDDSEPRTEEEFDIKAGLNFLDSFKLETEFANVKSESPEGDVKILEVLFSFEF